jgi:hypothetical protein
MAQSFQSKLLRYRMMHYRSVGESKVDCRALVPEIRQQAWTWLAPICDCPDLAKAVFAEILRQSQEAAGDRLVDPKCLVAEAALFFCHKPEIVHFFVGELTKIVNDLLKGRNEVPNLSAKKIGALLRELGFCGQRVAEGYKLVLTDEVRERIHRVARDYQVPAMQDGERRCRFCSGDEGTLKTTQ